MNPTAINRRAFHRVALTGVGGWLATRWARAKEPALAGASSPPEPLPFVEGSFTIVALPDTQFYCESFPQHFYHQTDWIVAHKHQRAIKFVVHLGDITNRNTRPQWEVARKAMQTLHGVVPYSLVTGNHDYGPEGGAQNRDSYFNEFFPLATAREQASFGGVKDDGRLENSYHTFAAGGQQFLVLAVEWGPRDEVLAWANKIVADHADCRVLLTTHAYLYSDDTRYDWAQHAAKQPWNPHSYGTARLPGGTNDGQQLWDNLVSQHKNFLMTLNGHVLNDGLARLTSANPAGGEVEQMLVNYQMHFEGGQGYLRLIEFLPDGKTVQVKAFSPSTGEYKTDPQNQFVLKLPSAWKA